MRPRHLATDNADQFDAHAHMFDHIKINDENSNVCILNNNPFITANIITEAFSNFQKYLGKRLVLDSLEVPGDYLYFRQVYFKDSHMYMRFKKEFVDSKINRQEAIKSFVSINNIRFGKPSFLTSYEAFKNQVINFGFIPVFLPKMNNFDLDDLDDWAIAEAVMKHIKESKKDNERNKKDN